MLVDIAQLLVKSWYLESILWFDRRSIYIEIAASNLHVHLNIWNTLNQSVLYFLDVKWELLEYSLGNYVKSLTHRAAENPSCGFPWEWKLQHYTLYRPKFYFWLKLARIEMKVDACDCRSMMIWNCNFAFAIPPQNSHCMGPAHFIMHRTWYKVWHQKVDGNGQYGENSTFIDVTEVRNPPWQSHGQIKNKSLKKNMFSSLNHQDTNEFPRCPCKKNWCELLW